MNGSQVNYPERLVLTGKGEKFKLSLKKGPQRENLSLDSFSIQLKRNDQALQPVIKGGGGRIVQTLTLHIPLGEKWLPLLHDEQSEAYTTLYLKNRDNSGVMQIYQNPRTRGLVKITLAGRGRKVDVTWVIGRMVGASEELCLPAVHFSRKEKVTPVRYILKERSLPALDRVRVFSFETSPSLKAIRDDLETLSRNRMRFDSYILDYGTAPVLGDWDKLTPDFDGKMASLCDEIKRISPFPGIRLSPGGAERKSSLYRESREHFLERGRPVHIDGGERKIFPLDLTREEVRTGLTKTLETYASWGFRLFHFDNIALLLEPGEWHDSDRGPLDRMRLLARIMEPFKKRGILFSVSSLALIENMDAFDMILPALTNRSYSSWKGKSYAGILDLALNVKNPPLLSVGALSPVAEKKIKCCCRKQILSHTQSLLNGPAMMGGGELTDEAAQRWEEHRGDKKTIDTLPLEYPQIGFNQGVLLLINKKRRVALINTGKKKHLVRLKEGALGDYKGLSPSDSTALKSQELLLPMGSESSHLFQV